MADFDDEFGDNFFKELFPDIPEIKARLPSPLRLPDTRHEQQKKYDELIKKGRLSQGEYTLMRRLSGILSAKRYRDRMTQNKLDAIEQVQSYERLKRNHQTVLMSIAALRKHNQELQRILDGRTPDPRSSSPRADWLHAVPSGNSHQRRSATCSAVASRPGRAERHKKSVEKYKILQQELDGLNKQSKLTPGDLMRQRQLRGQLRNWRAHETAYEKDQQNILLIQQYRDLNLTLGLEYNDALSWHKTLSEENQVLEQQVRCTYQSSSGTHQSSFFFHSHLDPLATSSLTCVPDHLPFK